MKSPDQLREARPGRARRFRRVKSSFVAFIVLSASVLVVAEDGGGASASTSKKGGGKGKDPASATEATNSGLRNFGQMIPQGSRSRGVRIPAFDSEGKPSSLIVADAMTRIDDTQLFSEKMVIQIFAAKKEEDMRIDLKTGTYSMDEQILTSEHRSRVSRSDFKIEGDSMVYDTTTGQGKMVGNVEMVIFDADAAKAKMNIDAGGAKAAAPADQPSSSPAPAAPPTSGANTAPAGEGSNGGEVPKRATPAHASQKSKTKKKK